MQDRPDASELLDSVAEYLIGELRPEVPREQRFKVLVAANVCAVVAREIRAGEGPTRQDLALFRELLGETDAGAEEGGAGGTRSMPAGAQLEQEVHRAVEELSKRLRSGELDDRLDELTPKLAEHVRRKLEVARPGYTGSD